MSTIVDIFREQERPRVLAKLRRLQADLAGKPDEQQKPETIEEIAERFRTTPCDPLPAAALRALGVPAPRESRPVDEDAEIDF